MLSDDLQIPLLPLLPYGLIDKIDLGLGKEDVWGDLGQAVHDAAKTRACVVDHTFRWALGRLEQDEDFCSLVGLGDQFQSSGFSYTKLVQAFVASDAFRYRRAETP